MGANVSFHGRHRIKKRCGVNKKGADRLANIAFEKGLSREDSTGSLRRYLDYLYHYNGQANNVRLYGDKVYIFCDEVLVTVLNTPKKYRSIVNKLMEKKVRKQCC